MGEGWPPTSRGRGVVEGAFLLLEALAREGSAGLAQLTRLTGLPKTSAHRLLDQLVAVGAVVRNRSGYHLGPAVDRLQTAGSALVKVLLAIGTPRLTCADEEQLCSNARTTPNPTRTPSPRGIT